MANGKYSGQEIRVGLFVIVAMVVLGACMAAVLGIRPGARSIYTLRLANVSGLEEGNPVTFGGFQVGRVRAMRVAPEDQKSLELTLAVRKDLRIPSNSIASVNAPIFGEATVEIRPGDPALGHLEEGSEILGEEPFDLNDALKKAQGLVGDAAEIMENLTGTLERITDRAETILAGVEDLINEENRDHVAGVLAQADGLLDTSRPTIEKSLERIESITETLEETSASARSALGEVDDLVHDNREDLEELIVSTNATVQDLQAATRTLNDLLVSQRGSLEETLEGMRETSQNLVEFTRGLKERPWELIRKTRPREEVSTYRPGRREEEVDPREGVQRNP